ncbi:hypothetical protein M9Y10_025346 [Tritrichomonas musculus]|uniref:Right handed beta helix domain-containing protein n=1 Tax=Tritrichomonas musculus TaxID=1915356 RepID=A0ABR2HA82_9EUKA
MNNVFIFTPSDNNKVNLYLENKVLTDETDVAHANVYFGGCTFSSTNANIEEYKHIEIVENEGGFETFTFNSCNCVKQGENTISIPPTIKFENIQFGCLSLDTCTPSTPSNPTTSPVNPPTETSTPDLDGYTPHGRIKETTIEINLHKCKFSYLQNTNEDGGAILITFNKKVNCTINDCKFKSCSGSKGGAISASYSKTNDYTFTIIDSSFEECSSTDLGGAIHIISGQPLHHVFNITGCRFINNKATTGGGIYAELRDQLTINNCHFENNEATNKGSSAYLRVGHNNIKNAVEEHDTFYIMNNVFIFTPSDNNKVNLYLENKVLTDETDVAHANVYFGGCTFSSTNTNIEEYKHIEIVENEGGFETFTFNSCNCVKQGENTISIPSTIKFENIQFGCLSLDTCTPSTPSNPTTSPVNPPTETSTPDLDGYTPHGRIKETTIEINLHKCKFSYLQNTNEDGGAILITFNKKVNCTINDCKFKSCSGSKGGAISASYSKTNDYTFTIIDSSFEECSSTDLGGAIHIISGQPLHHVFNITGCRFINNKAATGGGIYAELRDQLTINNCHFENNEATNKGSSAYLRVGHNNIKNTVEEHDTFYIMNNVFIFTPSDNNKVNLYLENKVLTDETDVAHANVYFGGCTFSSTNTNIEEYKHIEIVENEGGFETFTFNSCNCVKQGENTISIPPTIKFENIQFGCLSLDTCTPGNPTTEASTSHSASSPTVETSSQFSNTDVIPPDYTTQSPTDDQCESYPNRQESVKQAIKLEKACFFNLHSPNSVDGGAISAINASLELENCQFTKCSSSGNGGAIYVTFSSPDCELEIEECIFNSCSSGKFGGSIYFTSSNPRAESSIEECKFEENKAQQGAGAIYYSPCANSEMKDNLFVNNYCNNDNAQGSSLYVIIANQSRKKIKDDDDEEIKAVVIENNRIRSKPVNNSQQLFIDLKKDCELYFNSNSFSFDKTNSEDIPSNAKYIHLSMENSSVIHINGEICVDNKDDPLVEGFDSDANIVTDCHKADSENDQNFGDNDDNKSKDKSNLALIIGVAAAGVVVVVVIVLVVVLIVLRKKSMGRYIEDINTDDIADNSTTEGVSTADNIL